MGPKNNHGGDGYWVECDNQWCKGNRHIVCPPKEEGCDFGRTYDKNTDGTWGWRTQNWHRHLLVLRDGRKCYACGAEPTPYFGLEQEKKRLRLEIQHILPVSEGGSNCLHNLVLLCRDCHVATFSEGYGGIPEGTKNSWSKMAERMRRARSEYPI